MRNSLWTDVFGDSICAENINGQISDMIDLIEKEKVSLTLKKIIKRELTPRQRECFILHYNKRKDLKDIARTLGIDASTVCRHIKRAKTRIYKIMAYNFPKFI
jgi:RNA polymerase sigma factor (sigma-70 family)